MWRQQIFRDKITYTPDIGPSKGKEIEKPGVPSAKIAPNWGNFLEKRKEPIVEIIGKKRTSWKNQFMDQSFYRSIGKAEADIKHTYIHVSEADKEKRKLVQKQKGGLLAMLKPYNGPERRIQFKPANRGVLIFLDKADKVGSVHLLIPPILQMLKAGKLRILDSKVNDELKLAEAIRADTGIIHKKELLPYDLIELPAKKVGKKSFEAGFYYVTKLGNVITAQHESKIKAEPERKTAEKSGKTYSTKEERRLDSNDFRYILHLSAIDK